MTNNGFLPIWRKIFENPFCKDSAERLGFWVKLLGKAAYKEHNTCVGNQTIHLMPGQFITGRNQLAKESSMTPSCVAQWLLLLKKEHQIEQQTTTKYRLITIINWDKYQLNEQQNEQQMNNKRTTNEQQINTICNKDNKERKKEIDIAEPSVPPQPKKIQAHVLPILLYLKAKNVELPAAGRDAEIKRNLKAGQALAGFPAEKIAKSMAYCEWDSKERSKKGGDTYDWTLETVAKKMVVSYNVVLSQEKYIQLYNNIIQYAKTLS